MRRLVSLLALAVLAAFLVATVASCNGTTGDALVVFPAYAAGAPGASQPFTVGGVSIQLTSAKMRIGAVYVDESPSGATGFDGPVCIAPDVFAAQVPGGVEVNLLSPAPQEFSYFGNGTEDVGLSWQIWLTDGDINEANIAHMVDLQGVATRLADGAKFSFGAIVTINDNRLPQASDPSQPGLNPICKQRIVLVGGIDTRFFPGGQLLVTVDPRPWFNQNIDFSSLPLATSASCQLDADSNYGTGESCQVSSDCAGGFVCNADPFTPCSAGDTGCTCVAQYCIPDTNFATGPGAAAGNELFRGILTGGSAAYALGYANSP